MSLTIRVSAFLALAAAPLAAHAVIDFETAVAPDPYGNGTSGAIPDFYGGLLRWNNFYVMDRTIADQAGQYGAPGYANGFTSGNFLAYNGYGDPSSLSNATGLATITGISGYFGASVVDGATLTVKGFRNGVEVGSGTMSLVTTGATLFTTSFHTGADTVVFESTDGQFTLDDLSVVPEPSSIAALGLGLTALLRRKRSSK